MIKMKSVIFGSAAAVAIPVNVGFELWSVEGNDLTLQFGSDGDAFTLDGGSVYQTGISPLKIDAPDLTVTGAGTIGCVYYY